MKKRLKKKLKKRHNLWTYKKYKAFKYFMDYVKKLKMTHKYILGEVEIVDYTPYDDSEVDGNE